MAVKEDATMIKKPHIFGSIVIVAAFAFVLVTTGTTQQMTTQSVKSHIEALWATSGHSNSEGEAFRHWDEDGAVPKRPLPSRKASPARPATATRTAAP
jgi:hypothetical protein